MVESIKSSIRSVFRSFGLDLVRHQKPDPETSDYPPDFQELNKEICRRVKPFTMVRPVRTNALIDAVQYVVKNGIEGALVECGVWRGGSAMAMAFTLLSLGDTDREIWLYDTYAGMSRPTDVDVSIRGLRALDKDRETRVSENESSWDRCPLDQVKENLYSTGYPEEKIRFVKGRVEDTIPNEVPEEIALLRLDTDWYESTKHELVHLFPILRSPGVVIIDDYGFWKGSRRAVDEYLADNDIRMFLHRMDSAGRLGVKI
jgi:hypothetical protein